MIIIIAFSFYVIILKKLGEPFSKCIKASETDGKYSAFYSLNTTLPGVKHHYTDQACRKACYQEVSLIIEFIQICIYTYLSVRMCLWNHVSTCSVQFCKVRDNAYT